MVAVISRQLMPQLVSDIAPLRVMEDAVTHGRLGVKAGHGLLEWPGERAGGVLAERQRELLRRRRSEGRKPIPLLE